jgi:predicted Fe-Mo cluster-binding NifX family protein
MPRIGIPLTRDHLEAPIAPRFGKAKWLAVLDDDGRAQVTRNVGLRGRWAAELLATAGATDVVADQLGEGAWRALAEARIRVWRGSRDVPASTLVSRLLEGRLPRMEPPEPEGGGAGPPPHGRHRERRRGSFGPH